MVDVKQKIISCQGLYDNRNLRSSRYKRSNKERAEKKSSSFEQHIDDIDSGIKALDDIQIVSMDGGTNVIFSNPCASVSLRKPDMVVGMKGIVATCSLSNYKVTCDHRTV